MIANRVKELSDKLRIQSSKIRFATAYKHFIPVDQIERYFCDCIWPDRVCRNQSAITSIGVNSPKIVVTRAGDIIGEELGHRERTLFG